MFICKAFPIHANITNDSIQLKLLMAKHDTVRIEILNNIAFSLRINEPEKSLIYTNISIDLSMRNGYLNGLLNALKVKAITYMHLGQYEKSMDLSIKALKLADLSKNQVQISNCYNTIGSIYQAKDNYDMAIYYFEKSFKIEILLRNIEQASIRLYNIGTVYELKNNLNTAMALYQKSLTFEEQLKSDEGIIYALYGIGGILTKKGDFQNAENTLLRALSLSEKRNDKSSISYCTSELGNLYYKWNKYDLAISFYTRSLGIADSIQEKNQLKNIFHGLSAIYEKKGDFTHGYQYLKKYQEAYEDINGVESNDKIAELNKKYEIEKRDKEVELLVKDNEIKRLELNQNKNFRNYFIFMSILILIILGTKISKNQHRFPTKSTPRNNRIHTIFNILNNDIDRLVYSKTFWIIALNTFFTVYLILFQPFGINTLPVIEKIIIIAIYASFLILLSLLTLPMIYKYSIYFGKIKLINKYLIISISNIILLTVFIWLFYGLQIKEHLTFNLLIEVALNIVIVSIPPAIIAFLLSEQMIYAQYIEKFTSEDGNKSDKNDEPDFKLIIATDNVSETIEIAKSKFICVEANDNYSAVYYEKNGKIQKDLYRITLKKIETSLIIHEEFIRCHKSYIVNVNHLEKITGNSQKYKMKLMNLDFEIPISRNFPSQILQSLKKREQ